ncbi:MAG: glycosyltransferase [Pirellulales bacterium]
MITVVIPALNESKTIGRVVRVMLSSPTVSEVIVVDDGSVDGTPEIAAKEGASVITSSFLGKGASMRDGAIAASNEFLLYLDGDLSGFAHDLAEQMVRPLLDDQADFVKARFTRNGGRVTELSAKPLLKMFFPELLHIDQPLGGVIATRKSLVLALTLENDYGVDVGLLIDMFANEARIRQVDIGIIEHDSKSLEGLRGMASQVIRTILERARRFGRLTDSQVLEFNEQERRANADLGSMISRLGNPQRLALIDMDGTLIKNRFVEELARAIEKENDVGILLDSHELPPQLRSQKLADLLRGTPQDVFQSVAMHTQLSSGALELVIGLRKRGYVVGIVSDSYFIATEVIRRRVFADFSVAHVLSFHDGIATGELTISPAMRHKNGCKRHSICKHNVLRNIIDRFDSIPRIVAIGDNDGDACLLMAANLGIAFQPKTQNVARCADYVISDDLTLALNYVDSEFTVFDTQWQSPYLAAKLSGDGFF